jgi:predicted RNA binding protein YcfA (HicA-like mRNA interferase family)
LKQPRDLSGEKLARLLSKHCGYETVRQAGSHLRMTSKLHAGEHHITIPLQNPLIPGLLNAILPEVAANRKIDKKTLLETLFT